MSLQENCEEKEKNRKKKNNNPGTCLQLISSSSIVAIWLLSPSLSESLRSSKCQSVTWWLNVWAGGRTATQVLALALPLLFPPRRMFLGKTSNQCSWVAEEARWYKCWPSVKGSICRRINALIDCAALTGSIFSRLDDGIRTWAK